MNILNILDKKNKFGTIYYGIVKKIDDPTKQGRIKVELPEVYGDSDVEQLPWIYPIGYNSGLQLFNVPDLETEVGIIFIGDFYTGFYGIGKYSQGQSKIFDEDYPNVYGLSDLQGNYIKINKKTGYVQIYHKTGSEIIIDDEDTKQIKIKHKSGSEIVIDNDGNTSAKVTGTLKADAAKDVTLKAPNTTLNTNLKVTGTCTIDGTCTFESIKWKTHVHPYSWSDDGGGGNTKPPQN